MYSISVKPNSDINKTKEKYLNILLLMLKNNDLEIACHNFSETIRKGTIIFSYNITAIGNGENAIMFIDNLIAKHNYFFIRNWVKYKLPNNMLKNDFLLELTCCFE